MHDSRKGTAGMSAPNRIVALDGLRGLAVAAVLAFHGGVAAVTLDLIA